MKYPTWKRISDKRTESQEGYTQAYGKWCPDYVIGKYADGWYIKWRSSAQQEGPYSTCRDAKDRVDAANRKRA